jgi:predicted PurR-regulated permease PerM
VPLLSINRPLELERPDDPQRVESYRSVERRSCSNVRSIRQRAPIRNRPATMSTTPAEPSPVSAEPTRPKAHPPHHDVQLLQAAVTVPRALAYMTLVGLAVLFLWLTLRVDLVIFAGVLLAVCLRRAAVCASGLTRLPVGWALPTVVLVIITFFAGIGWFFSQAIASQIDQLSQQVPAAAEKVGSMIGQSGLGKTLMQHLNAKDIQTSPASIVQGFFGVAANVVEVVAAAVVVLFLAVYFAAEAGRYVRGLVRLMPPARRPRAAEILHETASAIWYWMLGRLFSMTTLGVMTALGLWLIGVPLPVALGFLAGIMIFVPYVGSIVSSIPSMLIAASIDLRPRNICHRALCRYSSHRGLYPCTAGAASGRASAAGADPLRTAHPRRSGRVPRPAARDAAGGGGAGLCPNGVCRGRAWRSRAH